MMSIRTTKLTITFRTKSRNELRYLNLYHAFGMRNNLFIIGEWSPRKVIMARLMVESKPLLGERMYAIESIANLLPNQSPNFT